MECNECEGSGKVHVLTMSTCTVVRGECCGGCGHDVKCEECNGDGEVELLSCCGTPLDEDIMICSECKEHC